MIFTDRFKNWLRWCAVHGGRKDSPCGSAEGGYRSPQIWEGLTYSEAKLHPVDNPDAELVNRAYVALSEYDRRVIKYVYFRTHWRPSWMAQKLNCHYTQIFGRLTTSRQRMNAIVDNLDKKEDSLLRIHTGNRQMPVFEASATVEWVV